MAGLKSKTNKNNHTYSVAIHTYKEIIPVGKVEYDDYEEALKDAEYAFEHGTISTGISELREFAKYGSVVVTVYDNELEKDVWFRDIKPEEPEEESEEEMDDQKKDGAKIHNLDKLSNYSMPSKIELVTGRTGLVTLIINGYKTKHSAGGGNYDKYGKVLADFINENQGTKLDGRQGINYVIRELNKMGYDLIPVSRTKYIHTYKLDLLEVEKADGGEIPDLTKPQKGHLLYNSLDWLMDMTKF